MNPINDKIYNLITDIKNFELAFDINERFEEILNRIWKDFITSLQEALKIECKDFKTERTQELEFVLYSKKWEIFKFYFNLHDTDFLEYGIGTNNSKYKKSFSKIKKILQGQEVLSDFEFSQDKDEIWFSRMFDENLSKLSGLEKILPDTKPMLISEYTQTFANLVSLLNDKIIEVEKELKKQTTR